mmetsp:Transcript_55289/g.132399  ORF Transcript_55289/g.132399 Transcript_55289/m.132399 type:complete len:90 (-) Transcript_55289:126-395(-)
MAAFGIVAFAWAAHSIERDGSVKATPVQRPQLSGYQVGALELEQLTNAPHAKLRAQYISKPAEPHLAKEGGVWFVATQGRRVGVQMAVG